MALIEIDLDITLTMTNGETRRITRDGQKNVGDNPNFFPAEVAKALSEFIEQHANLMALSFKEKE